MAKLDALHQLHDATPSVRALFDSIRTDGVIEGRTTVDELTADGSLTRRSAINLLRELAELGCGEFKVGRKGHPSRLEWRGDPAELVADVLDGPAEDANGVDASDEADEADGPDEHEHEDEREVDEEPANDELEVELELEAANDEPDSADDSTIQRSFDLGDDVTPPASKPGRRGRPKAKTPRATTGELIEHVFVLRPDLRVRVELPADLSAKEAEVLAGWIGSLSFERS